MTMYGRDCENDGGELFETMIDRAELGGPLGIAFATPVIPEVRENQIVSIIMFHGEVNDNSPPTHRSIYAGVLAEEKTRAKGLTPRVSVC